MVQCPGFHLLKIHVTEDNMKSDELLNEFRLMQGLGTLVSRPLSGGAPLQPRSLVIMFQRRVISAASSNQKSFFLHFRLIVNFALH